MRLVRDLGDKHTMILRNHGLLTCGSTVADTFLFMYILQRACEVQVMAQAGGGELVKVPDADPRTGSSPNRRPCCASRGA